MMLFYRINPIGLQKCCHFSVLIQPMQNEMRLLHYVYTTFLCKPLFADVYGRLRSVNTAIKSCTKAQNSPI